MSTPVTDKQHGFHINRRSVRQRSWRYVIAQVVVNIPFVTVFEKLPSFEICFISVIVINKPCPSKSILYYSYI